MLLLSLQTKRSFPLTRFKNIAEKQLPSQPHLACYPGILHSLVTDDSSFSHLSTFWRMNKKEITTIIKIWWQSCWVRKGKRLGSFKQLRHLPATIVIFYSLSHISFFWMTHRHWTTMKSAENGHSASDSKCKYILLKAFLLNESEWCMCCDRRFMWTTLKISLN